MPSFRLLPLLCLALLGCQRDPDPSPVDPSRAPGEFLLDLRDDGARLFGTVEPAPPDSDAPRKLRARWLAPSESSGGAWSFQGIPVIDARFVPKTQAAVVISSARELVLLEDRRALPLHLDSNAHGPLSISQDGRFLAYTRGEVPDLEVVRYDLARRTWAASSHGMAPAWCPVLSPDGSRLVFVSGATGRPELYQLQDDESAIQLTDRQRDPIPFPSGPSAPVWIDGLLAFEDSEVIHLLSLEPLRLVRSIPGTLPVAIDHSRSLLLHDPSTHATRRVALDGSEVAR